MHDDDDDDHHEDNYKNDDKCDYCEDNDDDNSCNNNHDDEDTQANGTVHWGEHFTPSTTADLPRSNALGWNVGKCARQLRSKMPNIDIIIMMTLI